LRCNVHRAVRGAEQVAVRFESQGWCFEPNE
jgi:hypothetical protein